MAEPLELKKTLNLPNTDFPMKAGLPLNEPKQLEAWYGGNLYELLRLVQRQAGLHRKIRFRQVQCLFQFEWFGHD